MLRYENKGYLIEVKLPESDYSVLCRYKYDKNKDKYSLSMWLMRNDIDDTFKIDSQEVDTQYISGNKDTIKDNILKIVEQASESGFFDEYVERFEYYMKCFTKGNNFYEDERMNNDK